MKTQYCIVVTNLDGTFIVEEYTDMALAQAAAIAYQTRQDKGTIHNVALGFLWDPNGPQPTHEQFVEIAEQERNAADADTAATGDADLSAVGVGDDAGTDGDSDLI